MKVIDRSEYRLVTMDEMPIGSVGVVAEGHYYATVVYKVDCQTVVALTCDFKWSGDVQLKVRLYPQGHILTLELCDQQ
jgi:hypothetical protein